MTEPTTEVVGTFDEPRSFNLVANLYAQSFFFCYV